MPVTIEQMQNLPLSTDIATQEELNTEIYNLSTILIGTDEDAFSADTIKGSKKYAEKTVSSAISDIYVLSGEVVEGLSNTVIPKLSTIADLVSAEVERIDNISANYVPLTAFQALEARVSALESRLSDYETIIDQINGTN